MALGPGLDGAKVALVHDWLTGMRGGERLLEVFCELFPSADLTPLPDLPGSVAPVIEQRRIVTSLIHAPAAGRAALTPTT